MEAQPISLGQASAAARYTVEEYNYAAIGLILDLARAAATAITFVLPLIRGLKMVCISI